MRNLIDAIWPGDGSLKTLLDLGCGDLWFTCGLPGVTKHVGIDLWKPYLEKAAEKGCPGFQSYEMDLQEYIRLQADDGFDVVVAIDVVEHFPEDRAKYVIEQMERVAARLCIVWTTLGFIEQGMYDNNGEYNPYQLHLWGPDPAYFREREWQVDEYPDWHGARGGAIFAYKWFKPADVRVPQDVIFGGLNG